MTEAAIAPDDSATAGLWPHQVKALAALRASLAAGHRRPLMQLPTGAGKTRLAAAIIEAALAKDKRVVFTVPAIELIDQTVEAFWKEGIRDVGVIQANHPMTNWTRPVQVASVQTLAQRERPRTDLVVVDEAHRAFKAVHEWMGAAPHPFIGLSATPWTRGLARHYDDLIVAATTAELIAAGFLSPFRVFAPSHPDLSGVRTVAGDYHEGDLSDVMDKPTLTADVVSTWLRIGEDRPTLCFAVDKAHARSLERQFTQAGVPTAYVDDSTPRGDRDRIRRAFHAREIKVVCNIAVLTTGIDWDVRCIILARPTQSEMLFVQIVGRGLRRAAGKDDCLILDHSDTTLRLGFVTDIQHDKLDATAGRGKQKPREKPVPKPTECKKCGRLKPPKVHECPSCGFAPERQTNVEVVAGDLAQVAGARRQEDSRARQQTFYSGLLFHAEDRGYKKGWVSYKFKERFGFWPSGLKEEPMEPTVEVKNWIVSSFIRWKKSQPREEQRA